MPSVLVIDDEPAILENLQFNLELYGYSVLKAQNGMEGLMKFIENMESIDAVITDMKMPGLTGINVVRKIHHLRPDIGIIVLTGHGDMDNAIASMREGALNYLQKPFQVENLILSLENAVEKKNILAENKRLQDDLVQKNKTLQDLHDSAQLILMKYAPMKLPELSLFDTAYVYKSCEKVGGDMMDVFEVEDNLFFYIFDVCSHGILAALNTVFIKAFFCRMKNYRSQNNLAHALKNDFNDLNIELCKNTPSGVFATVFAGWFNKKSSQLYYASAGHVDQYLIQKNTLLPLSSTGTILGSFENARYEVRQYSLEPGDKILLFTDGLTDTLGKMNACDCHALAELLEKNKTQSISSIVNLLNGTVASVGQLEDDLTILGLQLKKHKHHKGDDSY